MKKLKKALCLLLCTAVCLSLLAACAEAPQQNQSPVSQDESTAAPAQPPAATVDLEHFLPISAYQAAPQLETEYDYVDVMNSVFCGGHLWLLAVRTVEDTAERVLCGISAQGEVVSVPLQLPAADEQLKAAPPEGYRYLISYQPVDAGGALPGLLRTVTLSRQVENEDGSYSLHAESSQSYLAAVDEQGAVEEGVLIPFSLAENEGRSYLNTGGGLLWFYSTWFVYQGGETPAEQPVALYGVSPQDGSIAAEYPMPDNMSPDAMQPLPDGRLLVTAIPADPATGIRYFSSAQTLILSLQQDTLVLEEQFQMPQRVRENRVTGTFGGWEHAGDELWLSNGEGVYLWNKTENTYTLRYRWEDCGLAGMFINGRALLPDGRILIVTGGAAGEAPRVWLAGGTPPETQEARTVLTLGAVNSMDAALADFVIRFNQENEAVRIEPVLYTDADAAGQGLADGVGLLQRQLVQGNVPDILLLPNGMDAAALSDNEFFIDLYPYLDADTGLSREDLVRGVLAACEADGALPTLMPQYGLLTVVGSAAVLGGDMGWSWQEYETLTAGMSVPLYGFGRDFVLHYLLKAGGSRFVDFTAGKAHLDTPAFAGLLNAAKKYPETAVYYTGQDCKQQLAGGESAAAISFLSGFGDMRYDVYAFDGPVVYKGFPGDEQGNGSAFTATLRLGITKSCADPDAAWQFVRTLLLPEYQDAVGANGAPGFPVRRDSLQKLAEAVQKPLEYPALPAYLAQQQLTPAMKEYWSRGLTAEEAAQIVALIEATDTLYRYDGVIYDILVEEAAPLWAGQTTAEAAAAIMQSRIQTYLDEQG